VRLGGRVSASVFCEEGCVCACMCVCVCMHMCKCVCIIEKTHDQFPVNVFLFFLLSRNSIEVESC